MAVSPAEVSGSKMFEGQPLVLTAGIRYTDRSDLRFEQSLVFAETARDQGVPVVFIDSSGEANESSWVADAHRERGGLVLPARVGGIATQAQEGVAYYVANGAGKVVRTESDTKVELPRFADVMTTALDEVDVLVVGRTVESRNSMPPTQQRTEELAGWVLEQTHYMPPDALAGPRGYTVAGAEVLADYPSHKTGMNNWIYMYDTTLEARRRGLPIGGVEVGFRYPEPLVVEESLTKQEFFDGKRYDQFALQLNHLLPTVRANEHAPRQAGLLVDHILTVLDAFPRSDNDERARLVGVMEDHAAIPRGFQPTRRVQ